MVGATPAFLKVEMPLADGFYRSDPLFASGNEKQPLIVVGVGTKRKLEAARLMGLEFKPTYGMDAKFESDNRGSP